ncbi:unnamed protein product [Moneuplotes crassus]|uniref:IBB domain-containing protein n=1 Tax=Euplotes crassus TaxID=5936 RepID=A0AAD1XAT3_EUPCR|nr:unnamed protein product [Moneuplotes crassus]
MSKIDKKPEREQFMIHLRKKKRQEIFSKKRRLLKTQQEQEDQCTAETPLPESIPDYITSLFSALPSPASACTQRRFLAHLSAVAEQHGEEVFREIIDQGFGEVLGRCFEWEVEGDLVEGLCMVCCDITFLQDEGLIQKFLNTEPNLIDFLFKVLKTEPRSEIIDSVIISLTNLCITGTYTEEIVNRGYISLVEEQLDRAEEVGMKWVKNIAWSLATISNPFITEDNKRILIITCQRLFAFQDQETTNECMKCLSRLLDESQAFFLIHKFDMFPYLFNMLKGAEDRCLIHLLLEFYALLFCYEEIDLCIMVFTKEFQIALEDIFHAEVRYKSQTSEQEQDLNSSYYIEGVILDIFQNAAAKVDQAASMLLNSPLMQILTFEQYDDLNVVGASIQLFCNVFSRLDFDDPNSKEFITVKTCSFNSSMSSRLMTNFENLVEILESQYLPPEIVYTCLKCLYQILKFSSEHSIPDYMQYFKERGGEEILEKYTSDTNYNNAEICSLILSEYFDHDSNFYEPQEFQ